MKLKLETRKLTSEKYLIAGIAGMSENDIAKTYGANILKEYLKGTHCVIQYQSVSDRAVPYIVCDAWTTIFAKPYELKDNKLYIGNWLWREDYMRVYLSLEECSKRLRALAGLERRKTTVETKTTVTF